MIEIVRAATDEVIRDRLGGGVTVGGWGSPTERTWSWQFAVRVDGPEPADLLLKIPRWPEASTLGLAVAAGEQAATVAEFDALTSIAEAVADSGDPGLTAVEPIAYIPAINGILMRRLSGRSLRETVGLGRRSLAVDDVFARVGRIVRLVHDIGPRTRRFLGGEAAAVAADRLAVASADIRAPDKLIGLLRRLAIIGRSLDGVSEPVGNVHGDLNMGNVLVDRDSRVAVIDPNPSTGPQFADVALLCDDIRFDRRRLLVGRRSAASAAAERWAARVADVSGARDEEAWAFREALGLGERWLRIESETGGFRRLGLLPARRVLSHELRRRVERLSG